MQSDGIVLYPVFTCSKGNPNLEYSKLPDNPAKMKPQLGLPVLGALNNNADGRALRPMVYPGMRMCPSPLGEPYNNMLCHYHWFGRKPGPRIFRGSWPLA